MTKEIKLGDYVYIPSYSRKALKVVKGLNRNKPLRAILNDDISIDFDENGLSSKYHIEPIAFLASPENKAKIEQFYGCKLEDIPKLKIDTTLCCIPIKWG